MLIILVLTCLGNLVADAAPIAHITKADVSSSNVALEKLRGSLTQLASAQPTTAASGKNRYGVSFVEWPTTSFGSAEAKRSTTSLW